RGQDGGSLSRGKGRGGAPEPPVRHSKIRAPGDDRRSEVLIADQREIRRVGDRAALRAAAAVLAVTAGARGGEDDATAVDTRGIARRRGSAGVRRNLVVRDDVGALPAILDSLHQDVDFLIPERTPPPPPPPPFRPSP